MRKVIALMMIGLLATTIFVDVANAGSYYYTGKAYVSKKYRYATFTPEKITIKTNVRWDNSVHSATLKSIMYKTLNIKLYIWSEYFGRWCLESEKTYHNTYNNLGGIINQEFRVEVYSYTKGWWVFGKRYVKYIITIPKDRDLIHNSCGKTKIVVTLRADGSRYIYGEGFELIDLTVRGTGTYWVNPTPWDMYRKYWGYSASAQEYNELMAQQETQGTIATQPIEFDTFDIFLISMFILGVAILSYVFVSEKKKRRAW